uniref:Uncharacterized protein n=1 Tax=Tanacetum cinerariifolium TaxID=118510 RepID=A0A6L2MU50_TANCI|nr:hypothetical protein [Tanacetum cinerariifolium]
MHPRSNEKDPMAQMVKCVGVKMLVESRSLCNVGPVGIDLLFKKGKPLLPDACPALITDFRHGVGTFSFPYPTKPFDEVSQSRFVHHPFEAQTFLEPILYLAGLPCSWQYAPSEFHNVGSPSVDHSKAVDDNDQGESSSAPRNEDITGLKLTVVGDSSSEQGAGVAKGSKKRRSITGAIKEGATVTSLLLVAPQSKRLKREGMRVLGGIVRKEANLLSRLLLPNVWENTRECWPATCVVQRVVPIPYVQEDYSAHNVLFGLHHLSLKNKLDSLSLDDLANIYDVHALHLAVVGNKLTNKSRIMSRDYSKLVRILAASAKDYQKKLSEELDRLRPSVKEVEHLSKRCQDLKAKRE